MDVDEFHFGIVLEVFAQFGDIDIHGPGVEVRVLAPHLLQRHRALKRFVHVLTKQQEQVGFFRGELARLLIAFEEVAWCSSSMLKGLVI